MSFTPATQAFGGVVFSSDLKSADCILDYINGKGQFYIENEYYPVVKTAIQKKKPFADIEFAKGTNKTIHCPTVYYHVGGERYSRYFTIDWTSSSRTVVKEVYVNAPFDSWDDAAKKPKVLPPLKDTEFSRKSVIPMISTTPFEESAEDINLSRTTFLLNEAFVVLTYAYMFDIDLASEDYKDCDNNVDFLSTFIDEINDKLKSAKSPVLVDQIDEKHIAKYDEPIPWCPDPMDISSMPQLVLCYSIEPFEELQTLHYVMADFYKKSMIKRFAPDRYLSKKNAVDIMKGICTMKYPQNKIMYKSRPPTDPDQQEIQFNFQVKGLAVIGNPNYSKFNDAKSLFTQYFATTGRWEPITTDDYLAEYYKSRVRGDIHLGLEFKLGIYTKSSFGLVAKIAKIDVKKVIRESVLIDDATRLALARRSEEDTSVGGKPSAVGPQTVSLLTDEDYENYNEPSED